MLATVWIVGASDENVDRGDRFLFAHAIRAILGAIDTVARSTGDHAGAETIAMKEKNDG